jgi:hypothetical protein
VIACGFNTLMFSTWVDRTSSSCLRRDFHIVLLCQQLRPFHAYGHVIMGAMLCMLLCLLSFRHRKCLSSYMDDMHGPA